MSCEAKQFGDRMVCKRCALEWDTNDPHPPECIETRQALRSLVEQGIPVPAGVALELLDKLEDIEKRHERCLIYLRGEGLI